MHSLYTPFSFVYCLPQRREDRIMGETDRVPVLSFPGCERRRAENHSRNAHQDVVPVAGKLQVERFFHAQYSQSLECQILMFRLSIYLSMYVCVYCVCVKLSRPFTHIHQEWRWSLLFFNTLIFVSIYTCRHASHSYVYTHIHTHKRTHVRVHMLTHTHTCRLLICLCYIERDVCVFLKQFGIYSSDAVVITACSFFCCCCF